MAASAKVLENTQRLRYIRVLERFTSSIVNYLFKADDITKAVYDKKVDNNKRYLERIGKVALYKGEYAEMEKLVHSIMAFRDGEEEIDVIKEKVLHAANQIQKSQNSRRYKKDKHSSDKFKDWD